MSMEALLSIYAGLPERSFAPGEHVIDQGGNTGMLYFLKSGSVDVMRDEVQVATVKKPGAVLGEISVLLARPHMATVCAVEPTVIYVAEDPWQFMAEHPEVNFRIARTLAKRLDLLTRYLVDLKHQFCDETNHLEMVDQVLDSLLCQQHGDDELVK